MRFVCAIFVLIGLFGVAFGQTAAAEEIFKTEKAFERLVAKNGINAGFTEYLAPLGVMLVPDIVNGREFWRSRPPAPTVLNWNPVWIDVSSNGTLAYSIGNSMRRPNGKDDPNIGYGHYLSVWSKQGNGEYRALLDAGISHSKPAAVPTEWRTPADSGTERNERKLSAADSSLTFFETVEKVGSVKAYKTFLADDAILLRPGREPFFGKKASIEYLGKIKPRIKFAKRKGFVEAPDMAYVYDSYSILNNGGTEIEKGNFVQVWKLRKGTWWIAAELFVAYPKENS
ncbi:MAG: DUF4440 domain-containing protein [Pyrinomonadaceae bacterium]